MASMFDIMTDEEKLAFYNILDYFKLVIASEKSSVGFDIKFLESCKLKGVRIGSNGNGVALY